MTWALAARSEGFEPPTFAAASPAVGGTGVSAALVIGVIVAVLAIGVAFRDTDDVDGNFLAWEVDAPLVVVIMAAVAGVLFDEKVLVGFSWRRRRRHDLAERAEPRRLRRS